MAAQKNSLAKNSIFNVAYQLLNIIFPLITSAYTARILLPSGVGLVSYAQNIAQYFVIFAALGIPNYGIREIARVKSEQGPLNKLFSELFSLNLISTVLCSIVYYTMVLTSPYFADERLLYCATGVLIILNVCNVDWFYQGEEQYRYIAIRSFFVKIAMLVLLVILVRTKDDYITYALVTCAATAGNYFWNVAHLRKFDIKPSIRNLNIKRHLKPVFLLFATTIAIEIYTLMDTTMIGALCPKDNVGYYTYATRISKMAITVICAFGAVLMPRLSQYRSEGNIEACSKTASTVMGVLVLLLVPCGIGLFVSAKWLVDTLFGADFSEAITTLQLLSLLFFTLGLSNLFGTQILVTFGGEKQLLYATCAGAAFNVVANAILIPIWQQNGAAVASVVSELIVTVITYVSARKRLDFGMKGSEVIKIVVASLVMGGVIFALNFIPAPSYILLLLALALGAATYAVLCFALRINAFNDMFGSLKTIKR